MAEHYQPWAWKIPESDKSIKHNMIPRQDAYERVSGKAVFTRDVCLSGMLYAKILTSPHAHAKIVGMVGHVARIDDTLQDFRLLANHFGFRTARRSGLGRDGEFTRFQNLFQIRLCFTHSLFLARCFLECGPQTKFTRLRAAFDVPETKAGASVFALAESSIRSGYAGQETPALQGFA